MTARAHLEVQPATAERRILHVVHCWFCGRKWAPDPTPAHDEVVYVEGFCPTPCEMQHSFFNTKAGV